MNPHPREPMTILSFVAESDANAARERLGRARSVVVKVGSNVLVGGGVGAINRRVFTALVESISNLMQMPDRRVVLVTSGAVALGRRRTGRSQVAGVEETLSVKQALAAVGQPSLMHLYSEEFAFYGRTVAQLLLTREDVDDRERFLSARSTLRELASMPGVLPIINENDTVANAEIRFGDNDQLAALVAGLVEADLLIILSDVAAIYDRNPSKHPDARPIGTVYADDPALLEIAEPPAAGSYGTGGMATKVRAARIAASYGTPTIIAAGRETDVLGRILGGDVVGTLVVPHGLTLTSRKAWIRFGTRPQGVISIDDGAETAVRGLGKSLLPKGITGVSGDFRAGAAVGIINPEGNEIARGLAAYSSDDLRRIQGHHSNEFNALLGFHNGDVAVHRDDLVLVDQLPAADDHPADEN
jgi:glutamate 5-kinase